jgi:NAD(P)-dependent dehydrogenase (short-subunit alcohol dehydrogenase family)
MPMKRLAGKVALVTGAASGSGRGIVQTFGDQGSLVVCADRDREGAAATAESIRDLGGEGHEIVCDVTLEADIAATVAVVGSLGGGPDLLVNAAGIMEAQPLLDVSRDSFRSVLDINLFGLFFMIQACAPAMIAQGCNGRIINLASIAGRQGGAGSIQYSASKATVISITQSAGQALGPHGFSVNANAPGFIATIMWAKVQSIAARAPDGLSQDQLNARLASSVAVGRLGLPSDIVGAVLFLASGASSYIVGQTINVDGGVEFN